MLLGSMEQSQSTRIMFECVKCHKNTINIVFPNTPYQICMSCCGIDDDQITESDDDYQDLFDLLDINESLDQQDLLEELCLFSDYIDDIDNKVDLAALFDIIYYDDTDKDIMNWREHFGIDSDVSDNEADIMIEAAIPDRG